MAEILFEREKAVLEYIIQYIQRYGYGPTLREICDGLGLSSPATACEHIYKLEDKGFLRRLPGKRRGIEIIKHSERVSGDVGTTDVPIIGIIEAEKSIRPHTEEVAYMAIPNALINTKKALYVLQVKGAGMAHDGIFPGDNIVMEHTQEANDGDIVLAALPSGVATVKRIFFEQNRISLQGIQNTVAPLYTTEVKIQGRAVALIRKFLTT